MACAAALAVIHLPGSRGGGQLGYDRVNVSRSPGLRISFSSFRVPASEVSLA